MLQLKKNQAKKAAEESSAAPIPATATTTATPGISILGIGGQSVQSNAAVPPKQTSAELRVFKGYY